MEEKLEKQKPKDLILDSTGNVIPVLTTTFEEIGELILYITKGGAATFFYFMGFEYRSIKEIP